jgi:endoglucanase
LNSICWGALEYGTGYQDANQTAYLDSTLRWGLDWLIKAHPDPSTLYVLVGDDARDNNYWGGDQNIPTPRPVYQVNDTHPGTDVAASTSAAFSSCALLYANRTLSSSASIPSALVNTTYSNTLLTHSRQLLSFAVNATGGMQEYQRAVPQVADAYASSSYYDDLALAALFLGLADSSSTNIQLAKTYWDKGQLSQSDIVLNWDSKAVAIPVLMTQILASSSSLASSSGQNANTWKSNAEGMLDQVVKANGPGYLTGGGLIYFEEDSDLASLNPALNAAMLLVKYAPLASNTSKTNDYMVGFLRYFVNTMYSYWF